MGQKGVNIMEFCKAFNAKTGDMEAGVPTPVVITVYSDKSFTFITKTPPVTYFLLQAAGLKSGSKTTGRGATVGSVTLKQIEDIAKKKMPDMNAHTIESAMNMIKGSAQSIGLKVEG